MTKRFWVRGCALAAAMLMASCANAPDKSTGADNTKAGDGKTAEPGVLDKLSDSVKNLVGGTRDKPQILDLKPGVYVKSNEAIGDERDIYDKRITHGLVPLPGFADYANGVLAKLKEASGVTDIPGRVIVVTNDELDAGASADGNIFMSIGYIRSLKSEDELAALLGHELSHVLLHHHDSNVFSRTQKQIASLVVSAIEIRGALDSALGNGGASTVKPAERAVLMRMELAIKLNDKALHPAWGRRQEAEADRLGTDLMIKAGYSYASGMAVWLDKVAKWDAERAAAKAAATAQTQAGLQALAATGKFDQAAKQGLESAFNDMVEQLSSSHESGEKRREDIEAYIDKAYQGSTPRPPGKEAPYAKVLTSPPVRNVVEGYKTTFQARKQVADLEFAQAWTLLQRLTRPDSAVAAHALPNHLAYEALRGLGRANAGEIYLKRSAQAKEPAWETFESSASYYRDAHKPQEVLNTGEAAFKQFAKAPSSYAKLIAMYQRTGLTDAAKKLLSECVMNQADQRDACTKAARVK